MVLPYAERDGIESDVERILINWEEEEDVKVDPHIPATLRRSKQTESTKASYELLDRMKRHQARIIGLTIIIGGEGGIKEWIDLRTYEDKQITPELIEECLGALRKMQTEGQVKIEAKGLWFESGQDLLNWIEEEKTSIHPNEVTQ